MTILVVVNHVRDWPFEIEGARVVTARQYLTGAAGPDNHSMRVINLCRTDRYQGRGYYVSLLAEARGHRVLPDVKTPGELDGRHLDRLLGAPFIDHLQRALADCNGPTCGIDAWFGHDPSGRNEFVAQQLFAALRIPLLHAQFERNDGRWRFRSVRITSPNDIPADQHRLLVEAAAEYIGRGTRTRRPEPPPAAEPEDPDPCYP